MTAEVLIKGCHCEERSNEAISARSVQLAPHRCGAVEAGLDRVEPDVGPAPRVHELFPAPIEEALVALRDVALGDEPRIIRMRPGVPDAHRQILGVPAPEAAGARGAHLT